MEGNAVSTPPEGGGGWWRNATVSVFFFLEGAKEISEFKVNGEKQKCSELSGAGRCPKFLGRVLSLTGRGAKAGLGQPPSSLLLTPRPRPRHCPFLLKASTAPSPPPLPQTFLTQGQIWWIKISGLAGTFLSDAQLLLWSLI